MRAHDCSLPNAARPPLRSFITPLPPSAEGANDDGDGSKLPLSPASPALPAHVRRRRAGVGRILVQMGLLPALTDGRTRLGGRPRFKSKAHIIWACRHLQTLQRPRLSVRPRLPTTITSNHIRTRARCGVVLWFTHRPPAFALRTSSSIVAPRQ